VPSFDDPLTVLGALILSDLRLRLTTRFSQPDFLPTSHVLDHNPEKVRLERRIVRSIRLSSVTAVKNLEIDVIRHDVSHRR